VTRLRRCWQIDFDVLRLVHLQADHHERREQKKHDVNQRNDDDPRMLTPDWRGELHK
jgi:hypothetical protein